MSKIAEQKAWEEYPIIEGNSIDWGQCEDLNECPREGYIKGYDTAIQDFLEKAEKFFKSMYETMGKSNLGDKTIELFKNYMQNEIL